MVSSFYAGGFSYHLLLAGGASTAIARPGTVLVELFSRQLSASHGACHPGCGHGAHVLWPGQSARIILKKMRCRKRRYQGQDDPYDPRIKGESGSLDHHGSCVDSFWNHDLLAKSSMMKLTLITLPACLLRLLPKTSQNIPKHPKTNNHYIHYQPFTQQRFQQMCHHCVTQPLARPAHPKVTREVAGGVGRCRWGWSTRCIPGALETGWVLGS